MKKNLSQADVPHLPSRQIQHVHPDTSLVHPKDKLLQGPRVLFQRRWSGVAVELHESPAYVPPTLISCEMHPKLCFQLSGVTHATYDKGGLGRHSLYTGAGTLALLAPNQPGIELERTEQSADLSRFLFIHVNYNVLAATAAAEADLDIARFDIFHSTDLDDPLLKQLAYTLSSEMQQPEARTELYADTVACMLAMQLVRRHGKIRALEAKTRRALLSAKSLRLIGEYVHAHLHEVITLGELATIAGLSQSHFCTVFRRTTGQTPNQYVIAQRMARAAHLLARTDLTVAHIASLVGYQSLSQFSVLFRRQIGLPPGAYARRPRA